MIRPVESDYTSPIAYARALEYYCDRLEERKWTGLTDAELKAIAGSDQLAPLCIAVATTVEVTLKQKNSYDASIP
tara:strand:+ start:147 stop:371 length:225 start_codon:yes stop_codon:yes gene_type:complete